MLGLGTEAVELLGAAVDHCEWVVVAGHRCNLIDSVE